ncbi:MAG: hypothetical protein KDB04_15755 [Acidimicrobiales bacterium]|nr:hypothetical protein [Acidimicrobiales bacterium]
MSAVPLDAPVPPGPTGAPPVIGTAPKLNKRQRVAAARIVEDAPCRPVLLRAGITGRARMPRASLEITRPDGSVVGHATLMNTSAAFDPTPRWWLVGDPQPGDPVALVSEGRGQVLLPGGRLKAGPMVEPAWSPLAARLLGWASPPGGGVPAGGWGEVLEHGRGDPHDPAFLRAVDRFRFAAVALPAIFFLVTFAFLFAIGPLVEAGVAAPVLLVLPVAGGGAMALWSAVCRRRLVDAAARIEPDAARWGKEVAFTQSYWSGMRKDPAPWSGPLPHAAV